MIKLSDCPYLDAIRSTMTAYLPMWPYEYGAAQLYAESAWNPKAVSPAGALGIAQFLPGTWNDMVEQLGFPDTASVFDPTYAIPAFGKYLAQMRHTWAGVQRSEDERRKLAWASYNAGTGNIIAAQKAAGGSILYVDIIAALPQVTGVDNANQTRNYVKNVLKWYGQLTANGV